MSSRRWRSGRHRDREDVQPVPEVLAEAAGLHLLVQPAVGGGHRGARRSSASWSRPRARTRRPGSPAGAWPAARAGSSPISSRKSVEPSAISKRPLRWATAPVKAPFSCPKSSLSTSEGGSAAQLSLTRGRARRGLRLWMRVGDELLPDARLALEEDRARRGRHLLDAGEDVAQDVARADDPLEARLRLAPAPAGRCCRPRAARAAARSRPGRAAQLLLRLLLLGHVPVRPAHAEERRRPRPSPASRRGRSSAPARPPSGCGTRGRGGARLPGAGPPSCASQRGAVLLHDDAR